MIKLIINSFHGFGIAIVAALIISAGTPFIAMGTNYYVASVGGNDTRAGTSSATAWKTLAMASSVYYYPGDTLNLKRGSSFTNQKLELWGNGDYAAGIWNKIKAYGTGAKPRITNPPSTAGLTWGWEAVDAEYGTDHQNMKVAILLFGDGWQTHGWDISGIQIDNTQMGIFSPYGGVGYFFHDLYFTNINGLSVPYLPGFFEACDAGNCTMWDPYPYPAFGCAISLWEAEYLSVDDVVITNSTGGIAAWAKMANIQNVFMDKILSGGLSVNGNTVTYSKLTVLNAQYPSPGVWYGIDPLMFVGDVNCKLEESEIAYTKNFTGRQDASAVDFDMESVTCGVERCFIHDNDGSAFERDLAGVNRRSVIADNVCYNNGLENDANPNADYLKAAFLSDASFQIESSCDIYGNQIYKTFPGQSLNYFFNGGGFADDFTFAEMNCTYFAWGNDIFESGTYSLPLPVPAPPPIAESNLAPSATSVTVSSGTASAGNARDGILTSLWTTAQTTLPSIQYNWSSPQTIGRVRIFDQPSLTKWWQRGILTFSDGSSINVTGGILNNGQMREVVFDNAPKTVTWVKFAATAKVGNNIGLAELEVYQAGAPVTPPTPPSPGTTTLNFSDRPAAATILAGQYPVNPNGSDWGNADWSTQDAPGTSNRILYVDCPRDGYFRNPIGLYRMFILPEGKILKSLKIAGPSGAVFSLSQGPNTLSLNCTPTLTTYTIDLVYPTTSNIVNCLIDTSGVWGGADVNSVMIDDVVYGD